METKYSTLRKPKRKLCYNYANKERPSKQWIGDIPLSLGDIDKIFDDLDPSPSNEHIDLLPSTTLLRVSDTMLNESEGATGTSPQQERHLTQKNSKCEKGPNEDVLNPAMRSPSPEPDIDLDSPFNAHGPVKTSSPIEENMIVKGEEELGVEKHRVMSPILFVCEDEGNEEARMDRLPSPKSQCKGRITKQSDDSELESPPIKVVLSKPKMSSQKNKGEGSCKEGHPVKEKTSQKMTADLKGKRKAPRQENTEPPMTAVRQEPVVATPGKKSEGVHRPPPMKASTRVEKDMTAFLQKLRDAAQPKPSCSRKSLSPVKVPSPAEPEDDFLILEDDTPLFISIPSKSATNKRRSKTSITDKDSSADKEAKDAPLESAQKQQEPEQANVKVGSQNVNQKMKMKEKGKNEATGPGYEIEEFCSEELPAGDLMEQEKLSKKKQRLKRVPSKQSDNAEDQPEDSARGETNKETNTLTLEKEAHASSDAKRSKSLKDRRENGKTSKAKSLKGARKVTQESGAVKEAVCVEPVKRLQEQSSEEHADAEDPGSLSDKEIRISEAQMNEKTKQAKLRVVSEGSSSEDCQIVGKRKRRQPAQWWLSCPQISEETEVTDKQLTLKKLKRSNKVSGAAILSPVKTKKHGVSKRRNQMPPAPSSSQKTNKAKDKKTKQNKARKKPGDKPDKMKTDVFDAVEAEPIEEQPQEIPDQDLDHKDHSYNSGDQVYHHVVNEKIPGTPARDPSGSRERLREEAPQKRRKRPPSNWWEINGTSEDGQRIPSQTQQQESKPRKERKKRAKQSTSSGLGAPKNGNVAVSMKPAGGSAVSPLKVNPFPAPKTVHRSLATFKDLFPSAAETVTVDSRRGAGPNSKHEVTVTDCTTHSKTQEDVLSVDAGGSNSPLNPELPQNTKCQSDNMIKSLQSGPSSMIELEQHEDNDYSVLPSTRVSAVLSASDLCAPPLTPLILQPKDKANLTEWLKSLWSTSADNGPEITPDQFDWYFHRGRAIGFLVDLNSGFICNGKMLLGSYMKKPLWVDHSATTVFNILTSSVSVVIDGCESRFNPGQSFMVPCGHAYSIQNIMSQPAALYFTRVYVESSD